MIKFNSYFFGILILLTMLVFPACVDLEFDEPPVANLPDLQGNTTIAELTAKHTIGEAASKIEEDIIIGGIVVGDDETGNFYKQIAIQDETGGIIVRMNATGLFNEYPIGREVFVKCNGLYIGDYNGLVQLNGSAEDPIEEALISEIVVGGARDQMVEPAIINISDLSNESFLRSKVATLVQLDEVEFISADANATYADAANNYSLNRTLQDCDDNNLIIRTSGYCDFAAELTPGGNGTIVAVMTVYNSTPQLIVRDPADLDMEGPRCDSGTGTEELMTLAEVRDLFAGGADEGPENKKVKGVVISDKDNENINYQNMVIQDASAGILIRFEAGHSFSLGTEVEVIISGQELSEYEGLLQVTGVPIGLATSMGAASQPTPREATINEVIQNLEAWESTLVKVSDATISGAATYNGTVTVSDASGSIPMFTWSQATFSSQTLPVGEVSLVAIVSDYNGPQINIRNLDDVSGGSVVEPEIISLADLRDLYTGEATNVPAGKKIRGIVTSDKDSGNITGKNMVLQDEDGGIVVRFTSDNVFALGEDVEINISGMELSEYFDLLQLNNVPNSNATSFGPGDAPDPREATIQEILNNFESWESTLVKITDVTFTEGGMYEGSKNIDDGTNTMLCFTRDQASFASSDVPASAVTVTAIVTEYDGNKQITLRNLNDIE